MYRRVNSNYGNQQGPQFIDLPDDGTTWAEPMIKRSMERNVDTQEFFDHHTNYRDPKMYIHKKAILSHGPQIGVEMDPLEVLREDEELLKYTVGYRGSVLPKSPMIVGRGEDMGYTNGNNLMRGSLYRPPVPNVDQKTGKLHLAFTLPDPVRSFTNEAGKRGNCKLVQKTRVRHVKRNGMAFSNERKENRARFIKSSFMERPVRDMIGVDIAGSAPIGTHQRPFTDLDEENNVLVDGNDVYTLNPYQTPQQLFDKPDAPVLIINNTKTVRPEMGRIINHPQGYNRAEFDVSEYRSRRYREIKKFEPTEIRTVKNFNGYTGENTRIRRGGDVRTDRPYESGLGRDDTRPRIIDKKYSKKVTDDDYYPSHQRSGFNGRRRDLDETDNYGEKSMRRLTNENRQPLTIGNMNLPPQHMPEILLKNDEDDVYDFAGMREHY